MRCKAQIKASTYVRAHRCEKRHGILGGYCGHHRQYRPRSMAPILRREMRKELVP
jgi:hypothetical protein